ncbi:MAG: GNAT family N-acyltransferase [Ectothiorhodospiraceae bacterium]|jgi:putative hemolysin
MSGANANLRGNSRFDVAVAGTPADVADTQRLRYRVFAEELGASVHGPADGLEGDDYDAFCDHILVRDRGTGDVVACSRILDRDRAARAGGFYSQSEFDMAAIEALPGRIMELGRTCVHPAYRGGATISTLWSGLAEYIVHHGYDYLIGCASVSVADGGYQAHGIMQRLRRRYLAPSHMRVRPRVPLPPAPTEDNVLAKMPPLLKAYMALGARICGEPCWDPDFGVADLFILVDTADLSSRYVRHFIGREHSRLPRAASA